MSKRYYCFTVLVFLFSFFTFAQQNNSKTETEVTIITINNARQTSYKKSEESGNDTIVLEGSVSLSVEKGNSKNEIKADKVTYDRQTEMLYAEGNVAIIMKGDSSGSDTATADSLLLNTSTLEGIFDGGRIVQKQSDALNLPSGSTLIVFSEIFAKGNENVISFKNSSLTFCNDENPHWHIDATRTWLLPGGEFAFFNALLYVGVVPVLYFPAFYYPKDELIFNPVFSYTKREGYSVQTTTYLWGRKPLQSGSSSSSSGSSNSSGDSTSAESLKEVYNFIKPSSLKEQQREGLVLHNLDEDYKGDTSHYVKIMADWYSNLGYMVGVDGKIQPLPNYISKLDFNLQFGFSDTIFKDNTNGNYYPYSSTGRVYKDSSSFLGLKLPFRYAAGIEFALSKPFSLSLSIPVYSDPFFGYDFRANRKETMDWISYLLENSANAEKEPNFTEISSFDWTLKASYSPKIPEIINPYVSSLSLNMTNSLKISSKNIETTPNGYESDWESYSPERKFYYPSQVTPVDAKVTVSGTIFSYPFNKKKNTPEFSITLNKPDELNPESEQKNEDQAEDKNNSRKSSEEKTDDSFEYYLPDLEFTPKLETVNDTLTYKLNYSIETDFKSQNTFPSSNLQTADDFNWNNMRSSMYNMKIPLSISSQLNYGGSFLTLDNKIAFSPVIQKHTFISDNAEFGYTESERKKLILTDYKAENRDVINTNAVTIRPFINLPVVKETNIAWNSSIKLYRRKFTGDADSPQWDDLYADWTDEESITVNTLSADIRAKEFNDKLTQSLKFEAVMPPLQKKYTATLTLSVPYVTASVSSGFKEKKDSSGSSDAADKWEKMPIQQNLSVSLFDSKFSIKETYSYNTENNYHESLRLSASGYGLQFTYLMSYVQGYDFNNGWTIRQQKEFLPYSLSMSYNLPSKSFNTWFNRISLVPGLSTSVVADLLRPTNSYLLFSPSIKFKIHEFLDVTFSATSRNSVLYWYFHNEEGDLYSEWGGFPGNIFKDLIDSFRFDDESLRKKSGFKLKSLNLSVSHDLHDWKFNMTVKLEPRLLTSGSTKYYDFTPYITIGVVWNPMESMKTKIVDDYGEWKLE